MSRYAVIDVGTNSVLLLIAEKRGGCWNVILDTTTITRLGEGLSHAQRIGETGVDRTLECLQHYHRLCESHQVNEIIAVGTSALREAMNARDVLAKFQHKSGLAVEVIDGETEARLSYLAVRRDKKLHLPPLGRIWVLDVGGGSTELIAGDDDVEFSKCIPMGAVRMTEECLGNDPPTKHELQRLIEKIHADIQTLERMVCDPERHRLEIACLVGVGGTIVNLANVCRGGGNFREVHASELRLAEIDRQIEMFCSLSREERCCLPGLEPDRADIIVAGAVIVAEICRWLRLESIRVSTHGVRYGLLYHRFGSAVN